MAVVRVFSFAVFMVFWVGLDLENRLVRVGTFQ